MKKISLRLLPAALLAATALTVPQSATAAPPDRGYEACADFNVTISSTGGTQATRMTRIKDGIIYSITAGKGTTITVTNVDSGKSVTFGTKGSVTKTATNTETGEVDVALSGANLLLLFPEDVGGPGPSTILYTGLVRFTTDANYAVLTPFEQLSGTQRDICAELK